MIFTQKLTQKNKGGDYVQKKYFGKYFNPNQDLTEEQKKLYDPGTELINKRKKRKNRRSQKKCPNKKFWTEKNQRKTG
jgi:hypothetical protein